MPAIRRLALDRRAFLRGGAACLALPWLDAMQPALARPRTRPVRAVFVFAPNGKNMAEWRVEGQGRTAQLLGSLKPLAAVRDRCTVFGGLAIDAGRAHGDGPGDHARSAATFLTCAHPRKTGGKDLHVGVSIDQVLAQRIGAATPFPSLELGLERGPAAGACDSGYACAYSSNISWAAPDRPVVGETDPAAAFRRLFGEPESPATARQRQLDRSVLDLVRGDAKDLAREVGPADRQKLEQYLDAVRAVEQRLERLEVEAREAAAASPAAPEELFSPSLDFRARLDLMYELIVLALAADRTRVVSLMLGNGGSNRSYRFLGVPEGHHDLSHHGKVERKMEGIARIDTFHVERFAAFVQRLATVADGEGDLLGQSLLLFGSGLGDGNRHNHDELPIVLAGEGGGAASGRGAVRFDQETPLADLHVAIAGAMGVELPQFGDASGPLALR